MLRFAVFDLQSVSMHTLVFRFCNMSVAEAYRALLHPARDVSCAWFGGHVLPAAFAAVFARRQVRLRSAFAVLFLALKGFFSLLESGFASVGSFRILKKGHISCACRAFSLVRVLPRRMFFLAGVQGGRHML